MCKKSKNLDHDKISEILNISKSFYYKIENGTRNPALKLAFKIADILEYDDVRELFEINENYKCSD
jgi:DNA-binding XRE family transcriptional regulator